MNRYVLFFVLILFAASCKRPNVKKEILLKYHWETTAHLVLDGVDFIFDTNRNANSGYVLFLDDDNSVYKDHKKIGVITKADDSHFTVDVTDYYEVEFERWIKKGQDEPCIDRKRSIPTKITP